MSSLKQLGIQLIPLLFLFGLAIPRYWKRRVQNVRVPVKDKLLRPAGESLRLEIEKMDEKGYLYWGS